jgi:hypothetical protein
MRCPSPKEATGRAAPRLANEEVYRVNILWTLSTGP